MIPVLRQYRDWQTQYIQTRVCMDLKFELREHFNVTPDALYDAWMNGDSHSAMTGGLAVIDPSVGGRFTAWDEYITGSTVEIEANRRIVQTWRTVEFPESAPDSRLEIMFVPEGDGTTLILRHSRIPEGQPDYAQGWIDNYFVPMHEYLEDR